MTYWSDVHGANERHPCNNIALAMLSTHGVRHGPFRPIRLRMVERVHMLAGDAITLAGRSCRPIVPTGRPVRCIAVCSQRQIHVCIEQQLDDVWKAAAGGIHVR